MKRILSFVLAASVLAGVLSGCQKTSTEPKKYERKVTDTIREKEAKKVNHSGVNRKWPRSYTETPVETEEPVESSKPSNVPDDNDQEVKVDMQENFEHSLINYIDKSMEKENYVVSPLSFKFALSLLTEGAEGNTENELLQILGVDSVETLRVLSEKYLNFSKEVLENNEKKYEQMKKWGMGDEAEKSNAALMINNSFWKNSKQSGSISDSYKEVLEDSYNGTGRDIVPEDMEKEINAWVNENTNGMIPTIVGPGVSECNTVLVNTIYLRDSWLTKFADATEDKDFTTIDGDKVTKSFMTIQDKFKYYKDDETEILVMPTENGFSFIYVIGDETNLDEKLENAKSQKVKVTVPKIDIESAFDGKQFVDFLKSVGASYIFDEELADFSKITGIRNLYVDDIIQKVKMKTDEDGLEGAAATAILMVEASALPMFEEVKEFTADRPFSFYVKLNNEPGADSIFYGKINK